MLKNILKKGRSPAKAGERPHLLNPQMAIYIPFYPW